MTRLEMYLVPTVCFILGGCLNTPRASDEHGSVEEAVGVVNPAAAHCEAEGYTLQRSKMGYESILMCVDIDSGEKCPVWKFYRDECGLPVIAKG